jgi:hypothetical protein
MHLVVYNLLLIFVLYLFRIQIQNALTVKKMPNIPLIPQGTAQSILFSKLPRDQAFEQFMILCPEAEAVGMFQTQLFFQHVVWITEPDLIKELTSKDSTYSLIVSMLG